MADKLGDYIVGTAIETIEIEKLISQYNDAIVDEVYTYGGKVDYVVDNLQEYIQKKGVKLNTVAIEDIYAPSEDADKNVLAYIVAKDLQEARLSLRPVSFCCFMIRVIYLIFLF